MKAKISKLDAHTEQLVAWFTPQPQGGEGLTLAQARDRLAERYGLQVSASRLGDWWQSWQQARLQDRVLHSITTGAQQSREIEKQFSKDAPPEVETIVKLLRVLIMQLSVQATADPALLETVNPIVKSVLNFEKVKAKERELLLDERRVALLEKKAAQAEEAEKVVDSTLTPEQKQARLRQIFGMS